MSRYEQFQQYRSKMNCRILGDDKERGANADGSPRQGGTLVTRRFFSLDGKTYEDGALSAKTKELLGLVASMSTRRSRRSAMIDPALGDLLKDEELWEALGRGAHRRRLHRNPRTSAAASSSTKPAGATARPRAVPELPVPGTSEEGPRTGRGAPGPRYHPLMASAA